MTVSRAIVFCFAIACLLILLTTGHDDLKIRVAAISALALSIFATRLLPEVVTSLACFLAFIAIGAASNEVIFSGFASSSFWLLFAGLVIGSAITVTGLGQQVAVRIFQHTGNSYSNAALLLALSGLGLGVLVPSTLPRIIVLMPISLALAQTMGYAVGSRGHVGLTITAAISTLLPTYAILTANLPTIIHFGAIETLYDIRPSYAHYFVEQAPVNLVRFLVILALMLPFGARQTTTRSTVDLPELFTLQQKRLLALICVAILLWATDSWHEVSPAWVGLSLAALLLVPALGILEPSVMKTKIDLSPAFFLAAIFAISAVAQTTGLSTAVADQVIPYLGLEKGHDFRNLLAISGVSSLLSHLTTAPAAPAILAPLAASFAAETGWTIETVAMAQVIGIATPFLPYQPPPLIVAIVLAQIPVGTLTRICVILAVAVIVIGLPVTYVWWSFLGAFG